MSYGMRERAAGKADKNRSDAVRTMLNEGHAFVGTTEVHPSTARSLVNDGFARYIEVGGRKAIQMVPLNERVY